MKRWRASCLAPSGADPPGHEKRQRQIEDAPGLKDGQLHGIVNIDDVVKFAVQEMELESEILHEDVVRLQTLKSLR